MVFLLAVFPRPDLTPSFPYLPSGSDLQSSGCAHVLYSDQLGYGALHPASIKAWRRRLVAELCLGKPVCVCVCVCKKRSPNQTAVKGTVVKAMYIIPAWLLYSLLLFKGTMRGGISIYSNTYMYDVREFTWGSIDDMKVRCTKGHPRKQGRQEKPLKITPICTFMMSHRQLI